MADTDDNCECKCTDALLFCLICVILPIELTILKFRFKKKKKILSILKELFLNFFEMDDDIFINREDLVDYWAYLKTVRCNRFLQLNKYFNV